jgi:hypothetical protein
MKKLRIHDPVARLAVGMAALSIGALLAGDAAFRILVHRTFKVVPAQIVDEWRGRWAPLKSSVIVVAAVLFGLIRAVSLHPLHNAKYRNWLKLTPWRPGQPLPLGSITLTWIDAALLAAWAVFIRFDGVGDWLLPPILGLVAYEITSLAALLAGKRWEGLAVCWGLPAMLLPVFDLPRVAVIAGTLYLLTWRGITLGMRSFPWEREADWGKRLAIWPWSRIAPETDEPTPRSRFVGTCLLTSATAGWWIACLLARVGSLGATELRPDVFEFCAWAAVGVPLARVLVFRIGCRPPISLWGRIVKGRWIIPGFDRIYVAPVVLALVSIALACGLNAAGVPAPVMAWVFCTVVVTSVFTLPPSMRQWRHTGQFHIVRIGTADSQPPLRKKVA